MIYLIHGADSFRAREKLNELISEFRKKDPSRINLAVFDAEEDVDFGKIKSAAQAAGFLSSGRMVVAKNLFGQGAAEQQKEISALVQTLGKQRVAADFVFFENQEIKKNKEWDALAKHGTVFLFKFLTPALVKKWIADKLGREKIKISPKALETLALFVGSDLWRLAQELEKLILFKKGEKTALIGEQDIEALVKSDLPTNIFSTIDALSRRDKKAALKLISEHLEKGEPALYLLTMFVYQFRNLLKIKDTIKKEYTTPQQIAQKLKLHPYVVNKTIFQAKAFDWDYLKKIYKRFLRFDFLIKKGRLSAEAALEMIVIEVGNIS